MNILFLNTGTKIRKRNKLVVDVILRLDARLSRVCPKIFEEKGNISCGGGQLRLVRSLALDGGGEVRHCGRLADRGHHVQVVGGVAGMVKYFNTAASNDLNVVTP